MADKSGEVDQHLYEVLSNQGLEAAISFAQTRNLQDLIDKGTEITAEIREYIVKTSVHEVKQLTMALRKTFLPENLVHLFDIKTKKEAERFAEKELVINDKDFIELIFGAERYGFHHSKKHREFVPEHLKNFDPHGLTKADESGKFTAEGKKAFTKIMQIFKDRKQLSVHWFQFEFEWHCFFFDGRDLLGGHWKGGDHIHYLSYLWNIPGDKIWKGFDTRGDTPPNVHIKYVHNMREREAP